MWPPGLAVLVLGGSWLAHALVPRRTLDLVIVDKTVPYRNYLEHRSLYWILRHDKIDRPEGGTYRTDSDYLGAHPPPVPGDPPERTSSLTAERVQKADLVYLADTYGVYEKDLESKEQMKAALERSPWIYGGTESEEARAATDYAARGGTLLAEFNSMASPTGDGPRRMLEEALGVRWTRWIGRYFGALDDESEVPGWLRRDYEAEWNEPWEFTGPGYVLVQDDAHVEVLRVGYEAERMGLVIVREPPIDSILAQAADGVPYPYWFDVVERAPEAEVLASFRWRLTPAGRERLKVRGLPEVFPSVTRRRHGAGVAYYFAGDFADNPMLDLGVPFGGYSTAMRWLHALAIGPSEMAFYWRFYYPMMHRILADLPERARR